MNVPRILITCALVGAVVGAVFSRLEPLENYGALTEAGLWAMIGAGLGGLVGGLVIALLDRRR
jgi:membrane associated rhomboid family serine protease